MSRVLRLLIGDDVADGERIARSAAGDHDVEVIRGRGMSHALADVIGELRPGLVIVGGADGLSPIVAACADVGSRLVVVGSGGADEARRHGVLHCGDGIEWADLRAAADGQAPVAPRTAGRVSVVWGPVGSPGRSTVAVGVAAELAAAGRSVALIDADSYGAAIAPMLGLPDESAGLAAACRLAGRGALSAGELARVSASYPVKGDGQLRVLSGIARAGRWPELAESRVTSVIEACQAWAEEVVVDVGFSLERDEEISSDLLAPRRNAATFAALSAARVVIAVAGAEPLGIMRFVRAYPDLIDLAPAATIMPVINRVRWSALGTAPARQLDDAVERLAGIRQPLQVPSDQRAADAAFAQAAAPRDAAPRSALTRGLRRVAHAIAPEHVPEPARSDGRTRGAHTRAASARRID